jgi:hypothetical protein
MSGSILVGLRDAEPIDQQSLAETTSRAAILVGDHTDQIAEIDCNPLICLVDRADALIAHRGISGA